MAVSKNQVGFECEFVEAPAEYLQSECPICLHILREPYQVTCCGKSFCRQCIERVKDNKKPCPCCNKDSFSDFPNKGLQQPLYGFKVYCTKKEKGCEWEGELGQLVNHLNLDPKDHKELEGCDFAKIECTYCSGVIVRRKILHHKNELCDKRPFGCEYCGMYVSTYEDIIHNHWPVCGYHPVRCPNECGAFPQRQIVDCHVQKDCPLAVIECEFHYVGCEVQLPRRNMPDHLKDGLVVHFSLLAVSHKSQQEEIKALKQKHQEEIKTLERRQQDEIKALTEQINELKMQTEQLRLYTQVFPVDLQIRKTLSYIESWPSSPFYSHSQGYKLRLNIRCNIFQRYVLVCYLIQGEFDSLLKWPLKAMLKLILYRKDKNRELSIVLNCTNPVEGADYRCGYVEIGPDLSPCLCNHCIHVRVLSVQFH